ncbi:MAG: Lrp/AsnC ligand binding domain-containing protein [Thaumarchaeota archaeon]|uniref:Lrp/AsnC ligand binding domain-containing protein n=1 Tax=Candidatus Nitrosotenuis TaxID=1825023 RepID=UPI0005B256F4|nr:MULTISPECIES: Lrp/AsnC ligand binding domain-containing protein [Nitrosotenuis]MBI5146695.1 Lrp/AsnC ligand binding domain-containing protein [Nitrososphaerota archaeon]QLH08124.1 Lrp/AsnC family transcriptional regulator [Candidatus Nitrosotenuis sp. DW1]WKT58490.1 Lrp/AsnC ligand binding domain-containing protein [Candidatus Nitrosotenuis chungbukensis]
MPTAFILLNSDLGSDQEIIVKLKEILAVEKGIKFEVQGVYGIYDIVVKIEADNPDHLRSIITNKIRKIEKVQSTLTMMVIEEQEGL